MGDTMNSNLEKLDKLSAKILVHAYCKVNMENDGSLDLSQCLHTSAVPFQQVLTVKKKNGLKLISLSSGSITVLKFMVFHPMLTRYSS